MNNKSITCLPQQLNAEVLLAYLGDGKYKVRMQGHHKRNAYHDIVEIDEADDGTYDITLSRNSIYNILPECMFHSLDCFSGIPEKDKKEVMEVELERLEREKENAYRFFALIDAMLLQWRMKLREKMRQYSDINSVLHGIICDRLSKEQLSNTFIRQVLPMMPYCKYIRGDKALLTMLIEKALLEEGLRLEMAGKKNELTDNMPLYDCSVGDSLDRLYAGNRYDEQVMTYSIHFWPWERGDERFPDFIDELEAFRLFVKDWFISVEQDIVFEVSNDIDTVRLSNDIEYNYLNYNTNL